MSDKTNTTTVAISGQGKGTEIAGLLPHLFKDIDFTTLNATIDALGNNSKQLDMHQKTAAVEIISDWQRNVIDRLNVHEWDMRSIISFFNPNQGSSARYGGYGTSLLTKQEIMVLAEKTNTLELLKTFLDLNEEHENLLETKPEAPDLYDTTMSAIEIMKLKNDFEYENAKFNAENKKANRRKELAWKEFIKALNEFDEVKTMINKANNYIRNVKKLINECEAKSSLAKLNIQIDSEDVRKSLRDLMDFVISI